MRDGSTALIRLPRTRVVDKDPAHQLRRDAEEVRSIVPGRAPLIDQLQVQLIHESRWCQGVVGTFGTKLAGGDTAQLAVDRRQQPIERAPVAVRPLLQQGGYVSRGFGHDCRRRLLCTNGP